MKDGFALLTFEQIEKMIEEVTERVVKRLQEAGNEKELLSYREAALLLDIKAATVSKHARNGKFKSYVVGEKMYLKRSEIYESIK
jgi:excisionase family DNA binding protein|tara:strand:- start:79 stop:333 length:255 start_codon:yes stop_codon:yes gene_type:complete